MEDKSTEWILTLLAFRTEQISVLDTIIIRNGKAFRHIFNDIRETIIESSTKPLAASIQSLLNTQVNLSTIMCCLIHGSHRKFFSKRELKALAAKKLPKIDQIQICNHIQGIQISPTYILQVYLSKDKYTSTLLSKENDESQRIKNTFNHSYAKEVASVIINAIESEENKRVLKMVLEFVKDFCGKLYLHQVNLCKVFPICRLQETSFNSLEDINYFINQYRGLRYKNLGTNLVSAMNPEKVLNFSKISIDSLDSENEKEDDEELEKIKSKNKRKSSSRISANGSKSRSERSTRRASSIKIESPACSRRSSRNSAVGIGTMKQRGMKDDEQLEDSWEYGNCNVHFLEMISRQMIREENFNRPISPESEELKQRIRVVYEKMSLTPSLPKVYNFASPGIPIIRVSSDPVFFSPTPLSTRSNLNRESLSFGHLKFVTNRGSAVKTLPSLITKGVLAGRKDDRIYKSIE